MHIIHVPTNEFVLTIEQRMRSYKYELYTNCFSFFDCRKHNLLMVVIMFYDNSPMCFVNEYFISLINPVYINKRMM